MTFASAKLGNRRAKQHPSQRDVAKLPTYQMEQAMNDDELMLDESVLEATSRIAAAVAESLTEAGKPTSVDQITLGLSFRRGAAHWTARVHNLAATGHGPATALRRLSRSAAARLSA
jgi:hypothetical protein